MPFLFNPCQPCCKSSIVPGCCQSPPPPSTLHAYAWVISGPCSLGPFPSFKLHFVLTQTDANTWSGSADTTTFTGATASLTFKCLGTAYQATLTTSDGCMSAPAAYNAGSCSPFCWVNQDTSQVMNCTGYCSFGQGQVRIVVCESAGCECENAEPDVCGNCVALPTNWLMTLAGTASNNGCTSCNLVNTNNPITLTHVPAGQMTNGVETSNGCYWQSNIIGGVCGPGAHTYWQLRYLTGITFTWELQLVVAASVLVAFTPIATGSFNCLDTNVFSGPTWAAATCSGLTTATLTPA